MSLEARHALLHGLRERKSETELTRALASVFRSEPAMGAAFVRLAISEAPHGAKIDLRDLPAELDCHGEESVAEGRADLSFTDERERWHVIVEIKLYAGYGHDQVRRYLRSLDGAERGAVVAVTRDVPTYGDYADDDPRWAGSVQWARLLPHLRRLPVADAELARQWPLFLDVLEEEGAMGFTNPNPELFRAWAAYPAAREHLVDFLDSVRRSLLDALRLALAGAEDPDSPARRAAADFATRGKVERAVTPRLGTIQVSFLVPADGAERLWAGLVGWGELRFMVSLPIPTGAVDRDARLAAVASLREHGFENERGDWLTRYLPLTDELLADAGELARAVTAFGSESFRQIAASGILDLEPPLPRPEGEDDEDEPDSRRSP